MRPELLKSRKKIYRAIFSKLKKLFLNARIALNYSNPWELVVAVRLSAQCTDKKVNEITPVLFKKYRSMKDYAKADVKLFEKDIYSTGFYKNKAKDIISAAKYIIKKHDGKVPSSMKELVLTPGIGRKSANVILGNAYGVVEGIAVDTHVIRLANLFGLTSEKNPEKIEKDLMEIIPREEWFDFTYLLIEYGRGYCSAKPHHHNLCPLTAITEKLNSKKRRRL